MSSPVITRFAPSPTGFLHIGGARTALFNWLYAKHNNGEFRLRIEDTDKKRSTDEAIRVIIEGMKWLGLNHDHEIVWQSQRQERHIEVAHQLIEKGKAYYCYAETPTQHSKVGFRSKWRDGDYPSPPNTKPVVRLKVPDVGETIINDQVYNDITVINNTLEDLVILRSDGTPTYMLSVVVDDYDMNISHVIRGSDHITNTAKQILIYQAMGWDIPTFAHIPLIHGSDGSKLSKRDGALGIDEYEKMGFLPEAMRNYLLRLGWSHGDDEIISTNQSISWFNLEGIGKSPASFDMQKLEHINNHYLRYGQDTINELESLHGPIPDDKKSILSKALPTLTEKAKTLIELRESAKIFIEDQVAIDEEAQEAINHQLLPKLTTTLRELAIWDKEAINGAINELATHYPKKTIFQTLRALLTGTMNSPSILVVMLALGQDITIQRLNITK